MSSRTQETRRSLLKAALELVEETGRAELHMADVAKRAGLSRQAVYLHFKNRMGLLVALVQHIDEVYGLPALIERILREPDPAAALRENLRVTARYAPRIDGVAAIIDHARATEPAAAAAWQDRMDQRLTGLRHLFTALHKGGRLRAPWTPEAAADAMWAMSTPRTFRDLVIDRGWTEEAYETLLLDALERLFVQERPAVPDEAQRA